MKAFPARSLRLASVALIFISALALPGCLSNDDSPADPDLNTDENDTMTGVATTESGTTIETASGARIVVPDGAVPMTSDNASGTMAFSIERQATTNVPAPAGAAIASSVYRFGPEGFVFARPVNVTVPVSGNPNAENVHLYRIDPTSGEPVSFGGEYDPVTRTITAQTYALSVWFAAVGNWVGTQYGCLQVDNNSGEWIGICVESAELAFPQVDGNFEGAASAWCGTGCFDWVSQGPWYLPQGTYRFCVSAGTPAAGTLRHYFIDNVAINSPWTSANPICGSLAIGTIPPIGGNGIVAGDCVCTPAVTPAVGTGDLQVTLTWHSTAAIDLDLSVTDASGERCYYNNRMTASGGELDRDNYCPNYVNGRPENIFWTSAPSGQYTIEVNWYSDCNVGTTSLPYEVRVVNRGAVRTYSGTASAGTPPIEVARISVSASAALPNGARGSGARAPVDATGAADASASASASTSPDRAKLNWPQPETN